MGPTVTEPVPGLASTAHLPSVRSPPRLWWPPRQPFRPTVEVSSRFPSWCFVKVMLTVSLVCVNPFLAAHSPIMNLESSLCAPGLQTQSHCPPRPARGREHGDRSPSSLCFPGPPTTTSSSVLAIGPHQPTKGRTQSTGKEQRGEERESI